MLLGDKGMGRLIPKDFSHVKKYPYSMVAKQEPFTVEKNLILPSWHKESNQGKEGACTGFATSMVMSIVNEHQCRKQGQMNPYIRYNPYKLWRKAKTIDEWEETVENDDNGTSVKAVAEILKTLGHISWEDDKGDQLTGNEVWNIDYGIDEYRWATTIDEIRSAISSNNAVSFGINWYEKFTAPEYINAEYWIGKNGFGVVIGGHDITIYGASDERQAFRLKNSWGEEYPEVWLSYENADRLLREQGEAMIIIKDR